VKAALRRRTVVGLGAAALGAPWLRARAADAWLIGQSAPATGVLAASNAETTTGANLAFARINARGGIHGRPLQLVSLDDAQDAKRTAENTTKLLDQGVHALALYRTTPSISAALPLAQKAGAAFIGAQVGPLLLYEPPVEEVFNTRSRYHDEAARAVNFFAQLGIRRVGALVASDAFGKDVMAGLVPALTAAKAELVAQAAIDNRVADISQQVAQLKRAQPQVVILVSNARAAAEFVKAAKADTFNATFVTLSNTSSASFVKDLGTAAEGVIVTQVVPTPHSGRVRAVAEYREAVAAAGAGAPPISHASLQGWLTGRFIAELIRRAGPGATRERIVAASNPASSFDLGDFALNFNARSRQGSRLAELTVIGRDGRFMY
jgi:branched-chain amino acid transport system substrate-binding protein